MNSDIETLTDLLLAPGGGRLAANRTLTWLLEHHAARSVALWDLQPSGPRLALSVGLDQDAMTHTQATWRAQRRLLDAGKPWQGEHDILVPVQVEERRYLLSLSGLIPSRASLESVASDARVAAKALHRDRSGAGAPRDGRDIERDELTALLQREEWKIARVARLLDVTRVTIYSRMRRYGIVRPARA
jgi:transcriptional regulator of acetoin/glycerol metabolism